MGRVIQQKAPEGSTWAVSFSRRLLRAYYLGPGSGALGTSSLPLHSLCGHPVVPVHLQVSITFDPFLYLPVPLPQKQKVLPVFYFAREPHSKPIKVRTWPVLPGYASRRTSG